MDATAPAAPNVSLPTEAALRLSIEMLDAERPAPLPDVVRQTAMPDVWALTSEDRPGHRASIAPDASKR